MTVLDLLGDSIPSNISLGPRSRLEGVIADRVGPGVGVGVGTGVGSKSRPSIIETFDDWDRSGDCPAEGATLDMEAGGELVGELSTRGLDDMVVLVDGEARLLVGEILRGVGDEKTSSTSAGIVLGEGPMASIYP